MRKTRPGYHFLVYALESENGVPLRFGVSTVNGAVPTGARVLFRGLTRTEAVKQAELFAHATGCEYDVPRAAGWVTQYRGRWRAMLHDTHIGYRATEEEALLLLKAEVALARKLGRVGWQRDLRCRRAAARVARHQKASERAVATAARREERERCAERRRQELREKIQKKMNLKRPKSG